MPPSDVQISTPDEPSSLGLSSPTGNNASSMSTFRQRRSRLSSAAVKGATATTTERPTLQRSLSGFTGMFRDSLLLHANNSTSESSIGDSSSTRLGCMRRSLSFGRLRALSSSTQQQQHEEPSAMMDASSATASSHDSASPKHHKSHRRRQLQRSKSSQSCRRISYSDPDDTAIDELEDLTRELERMARLLGKVDDPQRILLKHILTSSPAAA